MGDSTHFSRRSFLQGAGLLALGVASAGATGCSASTQSKQTSTQPETTDPSITGHAIDAGVYDNFTKILQGELLTATGCTEPIAIAYASAKARETLGAMPERMTVRCSGSIVKNVKSVVVPNSGEHRGIATAALLGAIAGDSTRGLDVISDVSEEEIARLRTALDQHLCTQELEESVAGLYVLATVYAGEDSASVELKDKHDHISRIVKNGEVVFVQPDLQEALPYDKSKLNIRDILSYADTVDLSQVQELLEHQIECNTAISNEGLSGSWGACVGKTLKEAYGESTLRDACAAAAAGSDARMNGCAMPVVINSGSGNQGITCTMPVVTYAAALGSTHERLLRALIVSNLIALQQKYYIGVLSSFCGVVSAATAAACGIAYLRGDSYDVIGQTMMNSLGTAGGIFCDGAKSSCAGKIACSVQTAIMGLNMAERGFSYQFGEGIINGDYEQTIKEIGALASGAMHATDLAILNLMIEN